MLIAIPLLLIPVVLYNIVVLFGGSGGGAVVGVQPFGGEGLSGTGPKAGGPNSLIRYASEKAISNNISAQGGDPALLNL